MAAVRLSNVKVGDIVTYYTSHWKPESGQRKTATGKVTKLYPNHRKTGAVVITRTLDGHQADAIIPPSRIIEIHAPENIGTTTMTYREIRLTTAEADLWDWAAWPAIDFWQECTCEERDDPKWFAEAVRPAHDDIGQLVNDTDVAADMLYRLETQLRDMAIEEGGFDAGGRANKQRMDALRSVAMGKRIAAKIRAAFQET